MNKIIIHCSDTPNGRDDTAEDIHGWHLAKGWDESVLGAIHRIDDSTSVAFESVPASWMRNGFGTVSRPTLKGFELRGKVDFGGGGTAEGFSFMQLPNHLRPFDNFVTPATCLNSSGLPIGVASVYIGADGNCFGFNLPAGADSISLNGVDLSELTNV